MNVDRTTYRKLDYPIGTGYDKRVNNIVPDSIIVHTTNGNYGSSFEGEANYLVKSTAVGAHDLIGKSGQIVEFLPAEYRAWHAGVAIEGFNNNDSIGIECHHAVGEFWTSAQYDALTWRVLDYMQHYDIPARKIETHRKIALPPGRKSDPSDWNDLSFYGWRDRLTSLLPDPFRDFTVLGIKTTTTFEQFNRSLLRNRAPLNTVEIRYLFDMCLQLEMEPAFFIAVWVKEAGRPLGSSPLQQESHVPINIKTCYFEKRKSVFMYDTYWMWAESFFLGSIISLWHLKNYHGPANRLTVRQIIPVHAPSYENDTASYIEDVLDTIDYVKTH